MSSSRKKQFKQSVFYW